MTTLPTSLPRRHEIDALRSIALILLIIYHVFCAYQPFAPVIQFIQYSETLEHAWFIGEAVNLWRIPVLFLITGITAGYLLQNRSVGTLLKSRLMRLVPPLLFASFLVVPISGALFEAFNGREPRYIPNPGHLWFVWNLAVYFVFSVPLLLLLKRHPENWLIQGLSKLSPYGWLAILPAFLFIITRLLEPQINTESFATHFMRFWYGFGCFLSGAVLVSLGDTFWQGLRRVGHVALPIMIGLYLARQFDVDFGDETIQLVALSLESSSGVLAFLGYGSLLFSNPSPWFNRLNRSVFAVYIVHLPVQQAVAFFLFRLDLPAGWVFLLHTLLTLGLSYLIYAILLRPAGWLHPFFGIAPIKAKPGAESDQQTTPSKPSGAKRVGQILTLYVVTPLLVLATSGLLIASALTQETQAAESQLAEAIFSGNIETLRQRLENGADVNLRGQDGWPAFSLAIFARNSEALELMLDYGPDLKMRNDDGLTLPWAAIWMSDAECVSLLLEHGAAEILEDDDVEVIRSTLNQPYETAAEQIREHLPVPPRKDYLENRKRIRQLLRDAEILPSGP
ncbi:MAG: acyltransferase family protein [Verrucomicrobiota bacterium]